MNHTATLQARPQSPTVTAAHHGAAAGPKRSSGLPAFAWAVVMTLAMLGGIDQLASGSTHTGVHAASTQMATASHIAAPRT